MFKKQFLNSSFSYFPCYQSFYFMKFNYFSDSLCWIYTLTSNCYNLHFECFHKFFFITDFIFSKIRDLFFFSFIFYWRIIALQNFVVFCQVSTWISRRYTYVPSLLNLPPTSHPSRLLQRRYRAPVRVPLVIQLIPIGYVERWYWWTYLQGSNGDVDTENRLTDTG